MYEELGAALEGLEGNEPQGPRAAALTRLARGILKVGMRREMEARSSAEEEEVRGGALKGKKLGRGRKQGDRWIGQWKKGIEGSGKGNQIQMDTSQFQ